jgi:hypothetical protein
MLRDKEVVGDNVLRFRAPLHQADQENCLITGVLSIIYRFQG